MAQFKALNLTPTFGVEITGFEPRTPLDADTIAAVRKLFDEKGLLVFRDIGVDIQFQTYLSEIVRGVDVTDLSELALNDKFMISNKEPVAAAPYGRLLYHSDQMWSPKDRVDVISLYGKEVEQPSTPTLFISAADGWDTLPEKLRTRVKDRRAVQHYDVEVYKRRSNGDPDVLISSYNTGEDYVTTPIAYRHPRTGRTLLYVCQQTTQRIEGMSQEESDEVLDALLDHLYAKGKEFAHEWRERDLVIWDNLALQHARPNVKTEGPVRTLRKTISPYPKSAIAGPKYTQAADMA